MPNPLVSIIVPSFNQGRFIRETIESCLAQDYRPIEVLVIDGASTDETLDVLHAYDGVPEVCWISEPDSGPVEAVNKGFARARAEIGHVLSSDDRSVAGAFRSVADCFVADTSLGLVYGNVDRIAADGTLVAAQDSGAYSLPRLLSRRTFVSQSSAFFSLARARQLGGWDERFPYCPDTDLWFRLALTSSVRKLPRTLGQTRAHDAQRDKHVVAIYESYGRMVREDEVLARAPLVCRLAARAGLEILPLRYNPGFSQLAVCVGLWKAVLLHPPLLLSPALPTHRLVPWYFPITALVGRVRRLCGRPQAAGGLLI
jgi:hypothetical protein